MTGTSSGSGVPPIPWTTLILSKQTPLKCQNTKNHSPAAFCDSLSGTVLSVLKCTANLYCNCLSIDLSGILKQIQYRFAVNFGTLSIIISEARKSYEKPAFAIKWLGSASMTS